MTARTLLQMLTMSLCDPRRIAPTILSLDLPRGILWSTLVLVAVLSVLIQAVTEALIPVLSTARPVQIMPMTQAVVLSSLMIMLVFALNLTGQALGGAGRLPGAVLLIVWMQLLLIALQVVQLAVILLMPALALLVTSLILVAVLRVIVVFVDVLHGFNNLFKSLGVLALAVFGLLLGTAFILGLIGLLIPGGVLHV